MEISQPNKPLKNGFHPLEGLLVICLLAGAFLLRTKMAEFHPDESMWISQSRQLENFFSGNFAALTVVNAHTLTMPTVPEYIIGLSRLAGGYTADNLNGAWQWSKNGAENQAAGNMPTPDLLLWSRWLPTLLGMVSILITFYLVKTAFNTRTGYLWLALTLTNSWLIIGLQRAMGEAPLLFFVTLAMLAGFQALESFKQESMRYSLVWLALFGLCTGLAGQTKTNGLGLFAPGLVLLGVLTMRSPAKRRWLFGVAGLAALFGIGISVYVGINPFFWNDPIGATLETIRYRLEIMNGVQAQFFPKQVIHSPRESIQVFINATFKKLTVSPFPASQYLKMALALLGSITLGFKAWQNLRERSNNHAVFIIFLIAVSMSAPSLLLTFYVDRYYLFPAYFVTVAIALGLDQVFHYILPFLQQLAPATGIKSLKNDETRLD